MERKPRFAPDPLLLRLTIFCHELSPRTATMHHLRQFSATLYDYFGTATTHIIFQIASKEHEAMARFNSARFSILRLSSDDEKKFTAWVAKEAPTPMAIMQEITGSGFKVSVSWVFDQSAFCLSIIGTENTKKHKDCVMTTWSDDLEEVILLAGYKHLVVCGGEEWPMQESGPRWG